MSASRHRGAEAPGWALRAPGEAQALTLPSFSLPAIRAGWGPPAPFLSARLPPSKPQGGMRDPGERGAAPTAPGCSPHTPALPGDGGHPLTPGTRETQPLLPSTPLPLLNTNIPGGLLSRDPAKFTARFLSPTDGCERQRVISPAAPPAVGQPVCWDLPRHGLAPE